MHSSFRSFRLPVLAGLFACTLTTFAADVRVFVQFQPGQKGRAQAALAQAGARAHHEFDNLDAVAVSLPVQARAALEKNPNIVLIEEDPVRAFHAQTTPFGITMVQAPEAVAAGATGAGIKVGVIDSGVYAAHEDLQSVAITGEPDFGPNDQRTWFRDINSHGTHVVGTIAAANNSLGVVGVSPGNVAIHMVKVFGDTGGWVYASDLLTAARAAQSAGARIISMSLGGGSRSRTEERGLADLSNTRGVLLIASAGNDGNTQTSYPAGYPTVVSVAAIDSNKLVADFSQKNSDVEIAAPGVAVLSTVSYIDTSTVTVGSNTTAGVHVEFSARGSANGQLVFGGLGDTTNPAWNGKIVLVDRGSVSFLAKVQNVQNSGGLACLIANNDTANPDAALHATLGEGNSSTIPAIGLSLNAGMALQPFVGSAASVTSALQQPVNGYDYFDGTSMACPHVSGVAALIWSKFPTATNAQVRTALTSTAEDLGATGRDTSYGFGLVRAKAALDALAAAVGGGGGGADTTPPVISNVTAVVTNAKNGSFEITWTTNEPATSDVQLNGTMFNDTALTTTHRRTFRGTKGLLYTFTVFSTDAAGNPASAGPFTHQN